MSEFPVEPLYVSHETYAWMLETFANAGYGNDGYAAYTIMVRLKLKPFTCYNVIVYDIPRTHER